jgi:hypothetical protein
MNFKRFLLLKENIEKKRPHIIKFLDTHFEKSKYMSGCYSVPNKNGSGSSRTVGNIIEFLKNADPISNKTEGENTPFVNTIYS